MTLQNKLVGSLTSLVILPMLISLGIGYYYLQHRLEDFIVERLVGATEQKVKSVNTYFAIAKNDFSAIKNSTNLQAAFKDLSTLGYQANSKSYSDIASRLGSELGKVRLRSGYEDIKFVLDDKRDQVAYVDNPAYNSELGKTEIPILDAVVSKAGAGTAFSEVFAIPGSNPKKFGIYTATKIVDQDNLTIGVLVFLLDLTPVYNDVTNTLGLSTSGESFLVADDGYSAIYLTPLKYDATAALTRRANYGEGAAVIAQRAVQGQAGHGRGLDYRGKQVVAAWAPIAGLPWAIETKIDRDEALDIAKKVRNLGIVATVAIFLSVTTVVWFVVSRMIEKPLRSLQTVAEDLSNGHYDAKVADSMLYKSDEFGKLATFLYHISHRLKYEARSRSEDTSAAKHQGPHSQ